MKGDFSRDTFDPLKHFSRVLQQQGRVQVDADANEQAAILLHYLRTLVTDLIGPFAGPEGDDLGFKISQDSDNKNFNIGPGRYYVDGILCENDAENVTYQTQVDYPHPPELSKDVPYLVYLDVWERHITALEDDYIREKALGGPDTASRAKVVWQVKVEEMENNDENNGNPCQIIRDKWKENWEKRWQSTNRGLLKARVKRPEDSTDSCLTAPEAKYRGQENQLYRIEIHQGGSAKEGATFKWSRDNGSVACKVLKKLSDTELIVEKAIGFEPGIWIELSNDEQELRGEPGALVKLIKVEGDCFTLELPVSRPDKIRDEWPTKARRWDQRGDAILVTEGKDEKNWLEIENGIEIQFNPPPEGEPPHPPHTYRTGDYWLIPARAATGDIEWPVTMDNNGKPELVNSNKDPASQEPFGIEHHYAPLAIWNNGRPTDCRCFFTHLRNCFPDDKE